MVSEEILLIITKDVTGQASEEEKNLLRDWLSESKENVGLYHSYKEAFLNGKYEPRVKNKDEVFDILARRLRIDKYSSKNDIVEVVDHPRQMSPVWLKVASIVLILVLSSVIIFQTRNYWKGDKDVENELHEVIIKSNPRGVKSLITLPDGSKVKLNSESNLEYFSDFEHERSVKLIGEAFFEVVKDLFVNLNFQKCFLLLKFLNYYLKQLCLF